MFNTSECEHALETCDPKVSISTRLAVTLYHAWPNCEDQSPPPHSLPPSSRPSTPPTCRLSVLTPSACLPSTAGRPSTTSTSSSSSSTTCSSSSGAPTSSRPSARSRCRGPSPPTTGPSKSLRTSPTSPSSPRWDGPSGQQLAEIFNPGVIKTFTSSVCE